MGLILAVSTEPGGRQSDAIQRRLMAERRRWRPTAPHPKEASPRTAEVVLGLAGDVAVR